MPTPVYNPDEPTRKSADSLLREQISDSGWDDPECRALEQQLNDREKELKATDPLYRRLRKTLQARRAKLNQSRLGAKKLKDQTRRLFQAEGLTPRVRKLLVKLAEALNDRQK